MDQFRATSTNSPTDNPPITNEPFSFGPIASSNQIDFEEDRAGDTSGTEVFFEMKENVCNELLGSWICSNGNKELMTIFWGSINDCPKTQFYGFSTKCRSSENSVFRKISEFSILMNFSKFNDRKIFSSN